jgi:cytochrome c
MRIFCLAALGLTLAGAASAGASTPNTGAKVFENECADCHSLESGKNKRGPSLAGVVGRASASLQGYHYSEALTGVRITWTPQRLAQYLAAPKADIPGTKMRLLDKLSPSEIQNVITYLEQAP